MRKEYIDYRKTGYFADIVLDYLDSDEKLREYYNLPFDIASFGELIEKREFSTEKRNALVKCLTTQYQASGISLDEYGKVKENTGLLAKDNTYTVTTGHQLCLFTGPLYFIYKIFSTINLAEELKRHYPEANFVPVYWMASEDHDFDEINHFNLFGKKLTWEITPSGPVGRIDTSSLEKLSRELKEILGQGDTASRLSQMFDEAYLNGKDLADATRKLVHGLFHQYGLICLDPDESALKSFFTPVMKEDLTGHKAFELVNASNEKLGKNYKIQVNPREINLFYMEDNLRERLVREESGEYGFPDGSRHFTETSLLAELQTSPEKFSPNVVLRPLYQETILPNLAYIGGGAEVAYWMQLKSLFDHHQLDFPALVLRNSVLWIDRTSMKKLVKNNIAHTNDVFLPVEAFIKNYTQEAADVNLELGEERKQLSAIFEQISSRASVIDKSLLSNIEAEHQKAGKILGDLESRLMRAEKKNHETAINQLRSVKDRLFPGEGLQERHDNFASFYLQYGEEFFNILKSHLDPTETKFIVLSDEGE